MIENIANWIADLPWELIIFAALGGLTLLSAIVVVSAKRVTYACVALLPCFVGIAGLYATLASPIMLAFQLLIYAGGIMVLLLFAIFLLERRTGPIVSGSHMVLPAGLIAAITGVVLVGAVCQTKRDFQQERNKLPAPGAEVARNAGDLPDRYYAYYDEETGQEGEQKDSNVRRTGFYFLTYYVLPFELTSLILVVAMVGAIIIARRDKGWVAAGKIPGEPEDEDEEDATDDEADEGGEG